jgi:hypothetical protein
LNILLSLAAVEQELMAAAAVAQADYFMEPRVFSPEIQQQ